MDETEHPPLYNELLSVLESVDPKTVTDDELVDRLRAVFERYKSQREITSTAQLDMYDLHGHPR